MDELKPEEAEALDILESMLDAADAESTIHTGVTNCDKPIRSGNCRILADDAAKLRKYIADRRAEPENKAKALTLDELRKMDHSAIWVKILIPDGVLKDGYALIFGDQAVIVDYEEVDLDYVQFEDYGKTWLAYACKPEGSAP